MTSITLDNELESNLVKYLDISLNPLDFTERLNKLIETIEDLEDYRIAVERTKNLDYSTTIPLSEIMAKYVSS